MTLDATVGGTGANSYVTVVRAQALFDQRLYVDTWTAATTAQKEAALVWATTILDQSFNWEGWLRHPGTGPGNSGGQRLRWPRSAVLMLDGYRWYDYDLIPEPIERATCDLALLLLQRDLTAIPELLGTGISDVSVGPLKVTINPKMILPLIPPQMIDTLAHLGLCLITSPAGGQIKLIRA